MRWDNLACDKYGSGLTVTNIQYILIPICGETRRLRKEDHPVRDGLQIELRQFCIGSFLQI